MNTVLVGMQNEQTLEDSLVVPYKMKRTLTIHYVAIVPWYLPKELRTYNHT